MYRTQQYSEHYSKEKNGFSVQKSRLVSVLAFRPKDFTDFSGKGTFGLGLGREMVESHLSLWWELSCPLKSTRWSRMKAGCYRWSENSKEWEDGKTCRLNGCKSKARGRDEYIVQPFINSLTCPKHFIVVVNKMLGAGRPNTVIFLIYLKLLWL